MQECGSTEIQSFTIWKLSQDICVKDLEQRKTNIPNLHKSIYAFKTIFYSITQVEESLKTSIFKTKLTPA